MGLRLRMDRLSLRLAVGITVLVVGLLAMGNYALSTHHFERMIEARHRSAEMQNRVLEVALRHQMLKKDTALIGDILREVTTQPDVRGAMILDHDGVVKFSGDPTQVGSRVSRESPTCRGCHDKPPAERDRWTVLHSPSGEVLRTVQPIENRPECWECHKPEKKMNGMLVLDISLEDVQAQTVRDRKWMLGATAALALLLLGSVGLLVRRLVLARLRRLGETARSIAAGQLGERVNLPGDDTIARLADDFNQMASAIQSLVTDVRAHESQLADVMNSLDDGLVVLDARFHIVAVNQAFCRRVGNHPETLRGQYCRERMGNALPCGREGQACPSAMCLKSGQVQRATFEFPSGNGCSGRVEEVLASPVFDAEGKVTQIVEIWRDISERIEEEKKLAEIERLESLGVLASGFSHEINTPLGSTLACAEAILGRTDETDLVVSPQTAREIRDYAGTIRGEVLRCRRITEQFLRFARGIPPAAEPVPLGETVSSILSVVALTARQARVSLRLEGDETLPMVRANTEVIQHVLLNLLVNALQSFDAGGSIVVSYVVGSDVRVRVRDNGRGIPAEAQRHLFEPFRTSKPGGTGLGLFLSRRFMRRFGGDVSLVESQVGAGTCFEVVFLRAEGSTA